MEEGEGHAQCCPQRPAGGPPGSGSSRAEACGPWSWAQGEAGGERRRQVSPCLPRTGPPSHRVGNSYWNLVEAVSYLKTSDGFVLKRKESDPRCVKDLWIPLSACPLPPPPGLPVGGGHCPCPFERGCLPPPCPAPSQPAPLPAAQAPFVRCSWPLPCTPPGLSKSESRPGALR